MATAHKAPRFPALDERTDISQFPNLGSGGKQILKELEYQAFDNPKWRNSERQWWLAMRTEFLQEIEHQNDEQAAAYMKGLTENYNRMMGDE